MAALFTRTSIPPKRASVSVARRSVSLSRDTSHSTPQRLRAPGLDLRDGGLRIGDVRHHDPGTLGGDAEAVLATDAAPTARDDDDLVLEAHSPSRATSGRF